jgi:hypothetical protein
MFKWIRLIKFIKEKRKLGISLFEVLSTSDEIIVVNEDGKKYTYKIQIKLTKMKTWIIIIISLIAILYAAGIHIQLKPFKVSFDNLANAVAIILLIMAIFLFQQSASRKEYLKVYKEGLKKGGELMLDSARQAALELYDELKEN